MGREAWDEVGLGTGGREGDAHAMPGLDDPGGDLEQPQAQGRELGPGEVADFRDGVADREHQPVGGRVQHEAHLVGERRAAGGAVGSELATCAA